MQRAETVLHPLTPILSHCEVLGGTAPTQGCTEHSSKPKTSFELLTRMGRGLLHARSNAHSRHLPLFGQPSHLLRMLISIRGAPAPPPRRAAPPHCTAVPSCSQSIVLDAQCREATATLKQPSSDFLRVRHKLLQSPLPALCHSASTREAPTAKDCTARAASVPRGAPQHHRPPQPGQLMRH